MTYIFEATSAAYHLIASGKQKFDILNFNGKIRIGDTIIYQRMADTEEEETPEGEVNDTPYSDDEYSVIVELIFDDSGSALKNKFTAIGFKEKEPNN